MIRKFLDCSTAHLPPDFRRDLWQGIGPFTDIGEDQYCRWVYVDENTLSAEQLAEVPLPDAAQKIVRYALDNECTVICFDPDGPVPIEAYEAAKSGKPARQASSSRAPRQARRGSRRESILTVLKGADSVEEVRFLGDRDGEVRWSRRR